MKKNKLFKILFVLIIIVAAITIMGLRIVFLNSKIPNAKIETYNFNEEFDYNGLEVCVNNFSSIEFKEAGSELLDNMPVLKVNNGRIFFVKCHVKNKTDSEQSFDLTNYIQSKAFAVYYELSLFEYYNKSISLSLEPGEEKNFVFPYLLFANNFHKTDWEKIRDRDFSFVLTLYPTKRIVKLNNSFK